MDPRAHLGLLLCLGLMAVSLEHAQALGVLTLAALLPILALRPPLRWWARGSALVLTLVWGTVLSQSLFYAEQPRVALFTLGPLTAWREGAQHGLAQSLRFVSLGLAGMGLALSTPPDRMYAALLALRVPFGLALMTSTALRFLPEIAREVATVRRARAHRGRPAHHRNPMAWMALEVSLLRPVVARAWRRAHTLAESLDSRGFDPIAPRAVRRPLRMRASDWAVLGFACAITACVVSARLLFLLYTSDVLYVSALRPLYGAVRAWL